MPKKYLAGFIDTGQLQAPILPLISKRVSYFTNFTLFCQFYLSILYFTVILQH